jgi:hypothetical protein
MIIISLTFASPLFQEFKDIFWVIMKEEPWDWPIDEPFLRAATYWALGRRKHGANGT